MKKQKLVNTFVQCWYAKFQIASQHTFNPSLCGEDIFSMQRIIQASFKCKNGQEFPATESTASTSGQEPKLLKGIDQAGAVQ
ncbi:hypothetical protein SUGI_0260160 [Cryptomeria japonica]|nr:hypothetical protein SUGI_0260160 [Cryptomeria japonica]